MSSLIFLGLSVIVFIIVFGLVWLLVPMILGQFFSALDNSNISDPAWRAVADENEATMRFIIPLVPAIGLFILVLKVLMVASVRGRD